VFPIAVPPLRERSEDIPDLVRHFLARIAAEEGKRVRAISGEALALLGRHRWPGNVRQLENTVFRAVVLAEGDSIGVDEFPQIVAQVAAQPTAAQPAGFSETLPAMIDVPPLLDLGHSVASPGVAPSMHGALGLLDAHGDVRPLEEIEAEVIRFAMRIIAGRCRRSRGDCRSAAPRSTASSKISARGARSGKGAKTNARNPPRRINAALTMTARSSAQR
jgi:DNA-binding NtrC family response regulator